MNTRDIARNKEEEELKRKQTPQNLIFTPVEEYSFNMRSLHIYNLAMFS